MKKQSERELARVGPRQLKDPNSVEFAWQTLALLKSAYESKLVFEKDWDRIRSEAEQYRIYERIPPGRPYGSLEQMVKAELGVTLAEANAEVARRASEAKPAGRNGRPEKGSDNPPLPKGSTSAARLSARIARDHPGILARMKRGEFRSVRQAAIEAGIVKVKSDLEKLCSLWSKLPERDRKKFLDWIAVNDPVEA